MYVKQLHILTKQQYVNGKQILKVSLLQLIH